MTGRAEVVSLHDHVSSSYSCTTCCPSSHVDGWLDPGYFELFFGNRRHVGGNERQRDCYGNVYGPYDPGSGTWYAANPDIATVDSNGEVEAVDFGAAGFSFTYPIYYWFQDFDEQCIPFESSDTESGSTDVDDQTLHFTSVTHSDVSATFTNTSGASDQATLNLGNANDSSTICGHNSFTLRIAFSFPPGGTMAGRGDPRNRVITGANHQYEWLDWSYEDMNEGSGAGNIDLKVLRNAPNNSLNYIDIVLTGNNPSGTIGTFGGKGRLHLVCP
jgi:hypothetical protein